MSNKLKVVGLDPSLRSFGIVKAVLDVDTLKFKVEEMKLAQPPEADKATKKAVRKNSDDLRRARYLQYAMEKAVKDAVMVFVEVQVGSQSARSMAS